VQPQRVRNPASRRGRQPLSDLGEPRLAGGVEPGTGAQEIPVVALEHARLLGIEAERRPTLPQRCDAREELLVEIDLVGVAGKQRRHIALDRLDLLIGIRAGKVEEDGAGPVEVEAAPLQRRNRVVEARRLGIARDRVDLGPLLGHADVERRPEMLDAHVHEGRRPEGAGPGFEQRIAVCRRH
jgi:hypothetical protein